MSDPYRNNRPFHERPFHGNVGANYITEEYLKSLPQETESYESYERTRRTRAKAEQNKRTEEIESSMREDNEARIAFIREHKTTLFDVVRDGKLEVLYELLRNFHDLIKIHIFIDPYSIIKIRNADKQTLLHTAVSNNRLEIVKLLLAEGADPVAQDIKGNTPIKIAMENKYNDIKLLLRRSLAGLNGGRHPTHRLTKSQKRHRRQTRRRQ